MHKPRVRRKRTERPDQRELLVWFKAHQRLGIVVMHVPNEDTSGAGYGSHVARMKDGMLPGAPDLWFFERDPTVIKGMGTRVWCLEMKDQDGELNDNQEKLHPQLRRCGIDVQTAFSLEEAKAVVRAWGLVSLGA